MSDGAAAPAGDAPQAAAHGDMGGGPAPSAAEGSPHGDMGGAAMGSGAPSVPAGVAPGSVVKAEGDAGRTVAEVYAQAAALNGKPVAVRGMVVKLSVGIMGRNWVHLQDGTGTAANSDHDLTLTTDATPAVGDRVLATGTLAADRDFGAGYKYKAIVEEAKVTVEVAKAAAAPAPAPAP